MAKPRRLIDAASDPSIRKKPKSQRPSVPEKKKSGVVRILLAFAAGVTVGVLAKRFIRLF